MKVKEVVFDVWLGFCLLGMAVGLALPLAGILYALWGWLS